MRYLEPYIVKDLKRKMVFISGPRQIGKTTLAKNLLTTKQDYYLNFDIKNDRKIILSSEWPKNYNILTFDELHKMPKWKSFLKGIYDQKNDDQSILVTGSAKLDTFRKSGDALTGRYYHYRMHPFDYLEGKDQLKGISDQDILKRLLLHGGFPESFFNPVDSNRLKELRIQQLLNEDIRDLSNVGQIKSLEILIDILRERNGGVLSYANLASEIGVSYPTIKSWILLLEKLYLIFLIPTFTKGSSKSIKKEHRFFFYDISLNENGESMAFENLVALSLLKYCNLKTDSEGSRMGVCYYRDVEKREVDFVVTEKNMAKWIIEVKLSQENFSEHLFYLKGKNPNALAFQLILNSNNKEIIKEKQGVILQSYHGWAEQFLQSLHPDI